MKKYTWFKKIIGIMACALAVTFTSMNALAATNDLIGENKVFQHSYSYHTLRYM